MALDQRMTTRDKRLMFVASPLHVFCMTIMLCGLMPPKSTFMTEAFLISPLLSPQLPNSRIGHDAIGKIWSFKSKEDDIDLDIAVEIEIEEEEDDDDDPLITPYGNQTLAWTKRYRKLVPYEAARLTAMKLGLRSKEEWDDIREFGKAFHGAHLVSRPDELYRKEWISWEEFLGVMRPYSEAKQMVQEELKLQSMEEYISFVKEDIKRAESLRIPAKPEIYYRDKGWTGEEDFFN
ncbi:unnamed protein product [Cylindrotheca closterium]|uniref:Uncharacterized protein n=1 Tax=Cylindrotheca closterium TaxID=2856 RepID=A0AAD2PUF0_9STRA|nr:unnamed protein product [Cylindrotheca closterium]